MRINDGSVGRVLTGRTEAPQSNSPKTERAEGGAAGRAYEVTLSDLGRQMSAARQALNEARVGREERVAALKQSVRDGSYEVSAQEVARKLSDLLLQEHQTESRA